MAGPLVASLTLTLNDKLTDGLSRLKNGLENLRNYGRSLTLGKLGDSGAEALRRVTSEANSLSNALRGVEGRANRAHAKLQQMGKAAAGWGQKTFGHLSRTDAFSAVAESYSVYAPLASAAEYSNILRHSAITAHQYGPDADRMMAGQRALYNKTALDTAQDSHKLAEAGFWMSLTGMSQQLVDKLVPLSGKIATAYNAQVSDAAKTAFGLNYSMGIGGEDMERALGMLALLGKHGHFLFSDQAKEMPGVAAAAQQSHMTGMTGLEEIGAAMQISMKVVDPSQPNMAATNLSSFLSQIQAARDDNTFGKYGVNLGGVLMNAAGKNISPMEAALSATRQIQRNEVARLHLTDPRLIAQSDSAILNHLFRTKEARDFASAMLHNLPEYFELKKLARSVSTDMIDKDFHEAMRDLSAQMKLLGTETKELEDRIGFGFEPVVHGINWALLQLLHGVTWLDEKFPGLGDSVLAAAGSVLVLSAAVTAVGFAAPAFKAGALLVGSALRTLLMPVRWLLTGFTILADVVAAAAGVTAGAAVGILAGVAVLGAAAYDIIAHWRRFAGFFEQMWQGVEDVFFGAAEFVGGVFLGDMSMAWDGLKRIWRGPGEFFDGVWGVAKQVFLDFVSVLDGWTGGTVVKVFESIRDAVGSVLDKLREYIALLRGSAVGRLFGLSDGKGSDAKSDDTGAPGGGGVDFSGVGYLMPQISGQIMVGVDPSSGQIAITRTTSSGAVPITKSGPDPGQTLGRP